MGILFIIYICFIISFLFLNYTYYILKKYYRHIKYKEKGTEKEIDIQTIYAPLVPIDNLNYF